MRCAQQKDRRQLSLVAIREGVFFIGHKKKLQWEWLSAGSRSERLWKLWPWRFSKLSWARSWATWSNFETAPFISRRFDSFTSRGLFQMTLTLFAEFVTHIFGVCMVLFLPPFLLRPLQGNMATWLWERSPWHEKDFVRLLSELLENVPSDNWSFKLLAKLYRET